MTASRENASDRIDRIAKQLAVTTNRRSLLAAALSGAGLFISQSRKTGAQVDPSGACQSDKDCPPGYTCGAGNCLAPACTAEGFGCSDHSECCEPFLCFGGICAAGPQCGIEGGGCSGDGDCCPGLVCSGGICTLFVPTPPPPPPTQPPSGGDGDTSGGGGTAPPPSGASSAGGGATSDSVVITSLPDTGASDLDDRNALMQPRAGLLGAASAIGLGAIAMRFRRARGNLRSLD